jgi:hypothetical protein
MFDTDKRPMKRLGYRIEDKTMSQPIGPSLPTIGRIVHVEAPPVTIPAIVTAVIGSDGTIMATLFPPGAAPVWMTEIEHDEGGRNGTWHWPKITR